MRALYIDSNIWNFLFENQIDLRSEFPTSGFSLFLAGEQELENLAIPDNSDLQKQLKDFIYASIEKWDIKTDWYFGFYDYQHPEHEQRVRGFDEGRWASSEELSFIEEMKSKMGDKKKKTGLFKNEADIALAARSCNSIVLTLDAKRGPLKSAKERGWSVVHLSGYREFSGRLYEYVVGQL